MSGSGVALRESQKRLGWPSRPAGWVNTPEREIALLTCPSTSALNLSDEETDEGIWFRLIPQDKLRSMVLNALVAKAKADGPALLAAWHRDRRAAAQAGRGVWRWAALNVRESRGTTFELLSENASFTPHINSLIAKAHDGGPALLATWHRDRRGLPGVGKEAPDAEA